MDFLRLKKILQICYKKVLNDIYILKKLEFTIVILVIEFAILHQGLNNVG